MHEQLDRFFGLARLYYELTDDLMNGYLSLSAHRLNQIMQTLTVVSLILLVFHRRGWLGGRGRRR